MQVMSPVCYYSNQAASHSLTKYCKDHFSGPQAATQLGLFVMELLLLGGELY